MYEELVASRRCRWTSVEGNTFMTSRFIKVIFYTMHDVRNNKPYYSYGSYHAVVGGGTTSKYQAIEFVNRHLARDEKPLTESELDNAVEKYRQKILKEQEVPVVYFHSYDDTVVRCPNCQKEYKVQPHANYVIQCERCKKLYRIASI